MKFRELLLILIAVSLNLSACKKHEPTVDGSKEFVALRELLNGKYKILMSTADRAVDVNADGVLSTNLLVEIPDLKQAHLEIRLIFDERPQADHKYRSLFDQFWPEQYLSLDGRKQDVPAYDSAVVVLYETQGGPRPCNIVPEENTIEVLPGLNQLTPERWTLPEQVTIEPGERIKVISIKRLYCPTGWETVTITTLYERYSKVL